MSDPAVPGRDPTRGNVVLLALCQALNNFLVFSTAALASFSSGAILHGAGWFWVTVVIVFPMAVVLAVTAWLRSVRRRMAVKG